MVQPSDKVMFEIYREAGFNKKYRVIYYTELHDFNKEYEINRALDGIHIYDGFIKNSCSDEAKSVITSIVDRMNNGEELSHTVIDEMLVPFNPNKA